MRDGVFRFALLERMDGRVIVELHENLALGVSFPEDSRSTDANIYFALV